MVACDVRTRFVDAADGVRAQKGATAGAGASCCARRLERLAQVYENDYGVDVRDLAGRGAAGGLAGGLAAVGAELVGGFDLVAEEVGLDERIEGADLVVTGEGFLDEQSFDGKVVGGVMELARRLAVPVLVVCGRREPGFDPGVPVVSLVERCGEDRSWHDTLACLREVAGEELGRLGPEPPPRGSAPQRGPDHQHGDGHQHRQEQQAGQGADHDAEDGQGADDRRAPPMSSGPSSGGRPSSVRRAGVPTVYHSTAGRCRPVRGLRPRSGPGLPIAPGRRWSPVLRRWGAKCCT